MLFFGGPWDGQERDVPASDPNSIASYIVAPEKTSYYVLKLRVIFSALKYGEIGAQDDIYRQFSYVPISIRVAAFDEITKFHLVNEWDEGIALICFLTGRKLATP